MAELKKLNKDRNDIVKKGITDAHNEFQFSRTLDEVEDLLNSLKTYVDNYNRFKTSDHPSWPYQAKVSQNEL